MRHARRAAAQVSQRRSALPPATVVRAVAADRHMARAVGIPVGRYVILSLALAGAAVGDIAASLLARRIHRLLGGYGTIVVAGAAAATGAKAVA